MPTMTDVLRAARLLEGRLPPTPTWEYPALSEAAGCALHVKHENVQPVGAFKVRGGLNLLAGLDPEQRHLGVVTCSTGNHAQSMAYAARLAAVPCRVVMPAGANEAKVRATRALDAEVVLHGATLEDAAAHAADLARRHRARLVSPGDEPALIAGVATAYLELFGAVPDLDAVVVPVGSGTGAAAACLVARALAPGCEVIAVQSTDSPAAHDSWRAGLCLDRPNRTTVEGLATGRAFELPQKILRDVLTDFVLVADAAIHRAQALLVSHAHTLAEGAGAAALAAVLARPRRFAGRSVAVVCTGGNIGPHELATLTAGTAASAGPA